MIEKPRKNYKDQMKGSYLGPKFNDTEIKNKLDEVMKILPEGKKPTIAELTDSNWMDLTVILEEKLVREIAPDLKALGVEDIVEYSINKIIH